MLATETEDILRQMNIPSPRTLLGIPLAASVCVCSSVAQKSPMQRAARLLAVHFQFTDAELDVVLDWISSAPTPTYVERGLKELRRFSQEAASDISFKDVREALLFALDLELFLPQDCWTKDTTARIRLGALIDAMARRLQLDVDAKSPISAPGVKPRTPQMLAIGGNGRLPRRALLSAP